MKASTLAAALEGHTPLEFLKREIFEEVAPFRVRPKNTGISIPIYVTEDIARFEVQAEQVRRLCEAVLNGKLDSIEMVYLLTAVELCQSFAFSSESLQCIVARLSDDTEEPPTDEEIRRELALLT